MTPGEKDGAYAALLASEKLDAARLDVARALGTEERERYRAEGRAEERQRIRVWLAQAGRREWSADSGGEQDNHCPFSWAAVQLRDGDPDRLAWEAHLRNVEGRGRAEERAAIVAWLSSHGSHTRCFGCGGRTAEGVVVYRCFGSKAGGAACGESYIGASLNEHARFIEAGAHIKGAK